jgi:hypothetical protein
MVKEIAASGDAAYNQNAVTGGSLITVGGNIRTINIQPRR